MPGEFIGRSHEVVRLARLLGKSRLVTLMGSGGAGKTRLALEAAARYSGPVYICELGPLADTGLVRGAVGAALGFPPELHTALGIGVAERFGASDTLLILDNCEHLRSAVGEVVVDLLSAESGIRVLATSRERLRVPEEQAWMLPGLTAADGAALLAARTSAFDPGFAISDSNRLALEEISERLDGLPLALELVASRLALLPPQQVLDMLDQGLALDQTMRAALDWSVSLLPQQARADFEALGVFPGRFRLEAATAVLDARPAEVVDRLSVLRDASLLVAITDESVARFRLLEPVRQYAQELLGARPDSEEIQRRHGAHVVAVAEWIGAHLLGTPEQTSALTLFEEMLPDIRQAVGWALEREPAWPARIISHTGWAWEINARLREGEAFARLALGCAAPEDRARLLVRLASIVARRSDRDEDIVQVATPALAAAREVGDDRELGFALFYATIGREPAEADVLVHELADLAAASGDRVLAGWERFIRGNLSALRGDFVEARRFMEQAVRSSGELEDPWLTMQSTGNLILFCLQQGDYVAARRSLRTCLAPMAANPRWVAAPTILSRTAHLAVRVGKPAEALQLMAAAARIREEIGQQPPRPLFDVEGAARAALRNRREQEEALAAGRRLSLDQALAVARVVAEARLERPDQRLSRRELEVARMVARGLSNSEIAETLHLSVRTVESHVSHVLRILDLRSRVQIATWAAERSLD